MSTINTSKKRLTLEISGDNRSRQERAELKGQEAKAFRMLADKETLTAQVPLEEGRMAPLSGSPAERPWKPLARPHIPCPGHPSHLAVLSYRLL